MTDLVHAITELGARREWLDLVEREHGYLIAMARLIVEKRKEDKEKKNATQEV